MIVDGLNVLIILIWTTFVVEAGVIFSSGLLVICRL